MPKRGQAVASLITAAIFIVLEVAALAVLRNHGELQDIWISRASHKIMGSLWGGSESVRSYFLLKKQNESLALENYNLSLELARYREASNQEGGDQDLEYMDRFAGDYQFIPGTIIKMSRNKQHNYIIVNKGYEDGVRPQDGIITPHGAVGIIDAVEKHYSYGLAFMNTGVNVSARLGTEGIVGPLSWDGRSSNMAILHEIPLQTEFASGDTVYTSGYSTIFPADIPLGVVTGSSIQDGTMYDIHVRLLEDHAALRYVTIVDNTGRDEIIPLEQMEEEDGN